MQHGKEIQPSGTNVPLNLSLGMGPLSEIHVTGIYCPSQ